MLGPDPVTSKRADLCPACDRPDLVVSAAGIHGWVIVCVACDIRFYADELTVDLPRRIVPDSADIVDDALAVVDALSDYPSDVILSRTRKQPIAMWRQIAMALVREFSNKSLPDIGSAFGRHHTSVLHAIDVANTGTSARQHMMDARRLMIRRLSERNIA